MSRLVTFGCSFTYGSELTDPSSQSWPNRLGVLINKKVVNKAVPGNSNLEILHNILSFKFFKDDVVVIGWTYCDRDVIFNKILPNTQINSWHDIDIFTKWAEIHSSHDSIVRSSIYMHHASVYLDSISVKNLNFWAPPTPLFFAFMDTILGLKPKIKHKKLHTNILNTEDFANDQCHPGPLAHDIAAQKIFRILNAE